MAKKKKLRGGLTDGYMETMRKNRLARLDEVETLLDEATPEVVDDYSYGKQEKHRVYYVVELSPEQLGALVYLLNRMDG